MKKINRTIPTEASEQIALCQWLDIKKIQYFAVPNGGTRHKLEAINLKRQGVKAGVSDMVVFTKNKILFIELKRSPKTLKSGKKSVSHTNTSKEQLKFLETVNTFDYADGMVCFGAKQAIDYITSHI